MSLRTVLFWTHLVAGVIAGIVILVMSVTGVLLTYEKQMVAWAERLPAAAVPQGASRLSIEALLASARAARPAGTPTTVTIKADHRAPVMVAFGREGQLLVNPYSGAVIGEGAATLRAFFRSVTEWHRWLAMSGEQRATGRAITGAANFLFLILVLSGAYLWLPRTWTSVQLRAVAWFRGGLRGKARDFNWHNVVGLWSVVPLFIVVVSGVVISYPWAGNLVYRVMGEAPPPSGRPPAPAGRDRQARTAVVSDAGLEAVVARATPHVEEWRSIVLRVPEAAQSPVVVTVDHGQPGQPHLRETLTVDRATGRPIRRETFGDAPPGRRARMILRFAHTGEILGLTGQTIAGLVSAGGALLVYTGMALSLRRFVAWRRRNAAIAQRHAA
jgi:uncharacterized iron-regulated membrane protein